ncbi:CheY-like chemotaxis protein [Inhella inkyongensis]|uniref:CheY-like chemotaxis protein n=1 Tax=Inhella inkyongensis TaxID=392593 RepID=A0A840S875_9BURK|nr:response regulator [Inhella inkyongensis]MBB5205698.1 CheY-like chemotaxis protein [Inhella inkyongensis]
MFFDLPSMLGEYLLPLLILVPLALVVVLVAARGHKEDHWSVRPCDPWPAPKAEAPLSRETAPEIAAPAAPSPAAESPSSVAVAVPAPATPPSTATPYLVALDDALPPAAPLAPPAPTTAPRRRASDQAPGPAAPTAGPIPLLVVDDSAVVRAKLSKLLSGAGYAVSTARHGQDALEQLNQHWFAMMITDLEMPEMDGFELIAHVSGDLRTENLPIVAITGHEELGARVADVKGLYGIFKKPWSDRELLARVGVLTQLRPR